MPNELLRFFVARPPKPGDQLQPDRLGDSHTFNRIVAAVQNMKPSELQKELANIRGQLKPPEQPILLAFAPHMESSQVEQNVNRVLADGGKRARKPETEVHEGNSQQTKDQENKGKKALLDLLDELAQSEGNQNETQLHTRVAQIRNELLWIRDAWLLQKILASRLQREDDAKMSFPGKAVKEQQLRAMRAAAGHLSDASLDERSAFGTDVENPSHGGLTSDIQSGKSDDQRNDLPNIDALERAMKIGVGILLYLERPRMPLERIQKLISGPILPSNRLMRSAAVRQTRMAHAEPLKHIKNHSEAFSTLLKRRDALQNIKRFAVEALEQKQEHPQPSVFQKVPLTVLPRRFRIWQQLRKTRNTQRTSPDIKRAQPSPDMSARTEIQKSLRELAVKHLQLEDEFSRPLDQTLEQSKTDSIQIAASAKQLRGDTSTVIKDVQQRFGGGHVFEIFDVLEEEICAVNVEISRRRPQFTAYVARALSASVQSQLPVNVLGFIDLMRVSEELVDYTAREISDIENKVAGEDRERLHTVTESNQNILSDEQFEETEETRDLQTTQKNELQSATSQVAAQEFSVNAGVNVAASYGAGVGASVQINASLSVGYRSAVTNSQQTAVTVAKEVVSKAVSTLRQNRRQTQTATILRTMEERNRHAFKTNTSRSDIFLWVEKIHELTLKAYGKRVILEFFVPEPGFGLAVQYDRQKDQTPPQDLDMSPRDITADNYGELKQRYGATGVTPPPQDLLMVGEGWERKLDSNSDPHTDVVKKDIKIPAGYIPYKVFVSSHVFWGAHVYASFAGQTVYNYSVGYLDTAFSGDAVYTIPLPTTSEVDQQSNGLSLTVGLITWDAALADAITNVAVLCRRSCRAYEQWQLDTHDKLYAAYRARVAEYEEKRMEDPTAAAIGANPATNRQTELTELKKAATYILKGFPVFFDLYPSNGDSSTIFSISDLAQLRSEISFFEESFEWQQSTYTLYPSFWGNEQRIMDRKRFKTADPQHEAFLLAGAARLLVPILPGKEREVLEYLAAQFASAYASLGLSTDGAVSAESVFSEIWNELPPQPDDSAPDTWRKSLTATREDLVLGQGTVNVKNGKVDVTLQSPDSLDPMLDVGREIWIDGREYSISSITADDTTKFKLNSPFSGKTSANANYVIGARIVGAPWRVNVPTSLVVLRQMKDQIAING